MDAVERHVTLPTDLDHAWDLLTSPEDQAGWLGAEVALDPRPGEAGLVVDHDGTRRRLVVDAAAPGERLSWVWWEEGDEGSASTVEITLRPDLDGTLVTVVERPLLGGAATASASASVQASAEAGRGWAHRLLHLEVLLLVPVAVRG
jgi:uncharacterized protein YndB with AHSA1/START domain